MVHQQAPPVVHHPTSGGHQSGHQSSGYQAQGHSGSSMIYPSGQSTGGNQVGYGGQQNQGGYGGNRGDQNPGSYGGHAHQGGGHPSHPSPEIERKHFFHSEYILPIRIFETKRYCFNKFYKLLSI